MARRKKSSGNTRGKIVEALREGISTGLYPPGCKLPTVRELGARFNTSHANAAAAVNILTEEGLLTKRQGSGVYVPRLFEPEPDSLRLHSYYPINSETEVILKSFSRAYPEVKLYDRMPSDQADIWLTGNCGIREAAQTKQLLPLDDFMAEAGIGPEEFHPGALAPCQVDGKLYGIPLEFSPELLFFNRNLAKQDRRRMASWSFDDMLDYIKQESPDLKKSGLHPFVYSLCFSTQVYPYMAMFGTELLDESRSFCLIDRPESVATFQYFADLLSSCPDRNLSHGALKRLFNQEKAVLMPMAGSYNRLATENGSDFVDVTVMPRARADIRVLYGTWVGINADCRDPKQAWRLVHHMASSKAHKLLAETHALFPGRRDGLKVLKKLDAKRYGPLVERLEADSYVIPKLGTSDLMYLNDLLEEWYMTDNLLNYLRIAGRKLEQRLRGALAGTEETPGI